MPTGAAMPEGFLKRPVRSTAIRWHFNHHARARGDAFVAVHWERQARGAAKPTSFYGATIAEAIAKAEEYDQKRQAKFAEWREKRKASK